MAEPSFMTLEEVAADRRMTPQRLRDLWKAGDPNVPPLERVSASRRLQLIICRDSYARWKNERAEQARAEHEQRARAGSLMRDVTSPGWIDQKLREVRGRRGA